MPIHLRSPFGKLKISYHIHVQKWAQGLQFRKRLTQPRVESPPSLRSRFRFLLSSGGSMKLRSSAILLGLLLGGFLNVQAFGDGPQVLSSTEVRGQSAIELKNTILPGNFLHPVERHGEFFVPESQRTSPGAHYFHWRSENGKGPLRITCILTFTTTRSGIFRATTSPELEQQNVCWIQTLQTK